MTEMNFEIARYNMLEQQIRPWEVLDQNCLDIMEQIPREEFVPEQFKNIAFSDTQLPLAHQQYMLEPKFEAKILQTLQIKNSDQVLEIGTGSAYLTALLAVSAKQVDSIDLYDDFIVAAKNKLMAMDLNNVSLEKADFNHFDFSKKQYNVIVVGGSVPSLSDSLKQALTNQGRLFVVCGKSPMMLAKLYTRVSSDQWMEEILFETEIPALENTQAKKSFVF